MSERRANGWEICRQALVLCGVMAAAVGSLRAADADNQTALPKSYINKAKFYLPVILEGNSRNQVNEVHLYFKDDAQAPWKFYGKVQPRGQAKPGFNFQAPHEGEYAFTMVLVDKFGKATPARVENASPGLIVVFDTQAPQVDVILHEPNAEGQPFQVDIRDDNADPTKCRCFFQTRDKVWRPLEALAQGNQFCIPVQAATTGMIRVTATDMAGNMTTHEFNVATLAAAAPVMPAVSKQPALPPLNQATDGARIGGGDELLPPALAPNAAPIKSATAPKPSAEPRTEHVVHKSTGIVQVSGVGDPAPGYDLGPSLGGQKTAKPASVLPIPTTEAAPKNQKFINKAQLLLEYQLEKIGASGVGKVEVWLTRDHGKSWQKVGDDPDCKSPVAIELPGEGLYGVSLAVSNGRGFGGNPPVSGDTPEAWVEVDMTRPLAELVRVVAGNGDDSGTLLIQWNVHDRNLAAEPVELHYSTSREGPWQPIAKGLQAEGRYRWVVPSTAGPQAFIRLVGRDQAGNTTTTETPQAILLDDQSRPQGRLVGIAPYSPEATGARNP